MRFVFQAAKLTCLAGALILGALVIAGLLAPYSQLADSFGHFRLHFSVMLLCSILVLLSLGCWRSSALLFCIALAGLASIDFTANARNADNASQFTVLQLNLLFNNKSPDEVISFIKKSNADVIMLQEVSRKNMRIVEAISVNYPNKTICPFAGVGAVAVLSRLPATDNNSSGCKARQGLGWIRVIVNGKAISFASIHLHWPYPFGQHRQITALQKTLQKIPRPVILAGDFNAAPWSHSVQRIAQATDTQVVGGVRFTLALRLSGIWFPSYLPIDHILLPKELSLKTINVGPSVGSDHSAVITRAYF